MPDTTEDLTWRTDFARFGGPFVITNADRRKVGGNTFEADNRMVYLSSNPEIK
ncbi:MAG TPA: hypothetical protein VHE61_15065 [Opitutaceae bacterium]|nr:hypothetical protein [Opitutaceae bacterium]